MVFTKLNRENFCKDFHLIEHLVKYGCDLNTYFSFEYEENKDAPCTSREIINDNISTKINQTEKKRILSSGSVSNIKRLNLEKSLDELNLNSDENIQDNMSENDGANIVKLRENRLRSGKLRCGKNSAKAQSKTGGSKKKNLSKGTKINLLTDEEVHNIEIIDKNDV